ncbi:hypothetical protein C8C83_4353 [Flavobacterium sp. 90]|nr:hypothetical protein C8C82_4691 [Flavobacterium sp. 81]TCK56340.1 hypothetical protein C8C83_4353 [Flavobacterium sp. 90]
MHKLDQHYEKTFAHFTVNIFYRKARKDLRKVRKVFRQSFARFCVERHNYFYRKVRKDLRKVRKVFRQSFANFLLTNAITNMKKLLRTLRLNFFSIYNFINIDFRSFGSIFFVLCPFPVVSSTNRIDPVSKVLFSPNEVSISTPPSNKTIY